MAKSIRIPIEQLSEGMTLGDDVVNSNGLILIPKNTVIHQKHIFRLKLYDILSVIILDLPVTDYYPEAIRQPHANIHIERTDLPFLEFQNNYAIKETQIKHHLESISNGEPVQIDELLDISYSLLEQLKTKSNLFNYLHDIKTTDDYTFSHSINVSLLSNIFAHWLQLTHKEIEEITLAGLLHDLGKTKISLDLLNKPGKLTDEEFASIKKHSQYGFELIKDQTIPYDVKMGVLMHHEKLNGSGYPLGIKDEYIHPYAKIISIVDIYDAMTSTRSYHEKACPFKVIHMFEYESYGLLDTSMLFVFLANIAHNYLGKVVRLSSGDEGKIIFIHNTSPSKPIIEIGEKILDLAVLPHLSIEEILY